MMHMSRLHQKFTLKEWRTKTEVHLLKKKYFECMESSMDVSKIQWIKYVIYVYTVDKFEERKYTVLN